jgi:hypothetical protein
MMSHLSKVPFEQLDEELQSAMVESDAVLGGSEWSQVFSKTPDLYKGFAKCYYEHIMTDADGISVKLTELIRHEIALINQCHL